MKQIYLIIFLALLSVDAYAQQDKVYEVEFSRDDCTVKQDDGFYNITPVSLEFRMLDSQMVKREKI